MLHSDMDIACFMAQLMTAMGASYPNGYELWWLSQKKWMRSQFKKLTQEQRDHLVPLWRKQKKKLTTENLERYRKKDPPTGGVET